jgi:hypothetical protein
MKLKLPLQLFLLFFVSISFAQVGIGTTTPNGALDVTSTTQGFLLPRVELTASNVTAPVVNPTGGALANGTLVYNTATAGVFPNNVLPGYYYWNGSQWIRLNADASWITHGNSGTDASINFIGTTDNVDFVTRTNNIERLRVKNDGNIGIGTNNPNSSAILELSAIDKAILIPRVADVSLIISPVNGMLVYDISLGCFRGFQNGDWSGCLGSNGAIVTLDCNGASHLGVLYEGVSANAVSTLISYTGSNGGSHNGQTINSTGVTGLTAILNAGTFASGSSILIFNIFGTPSSNGVATFDVTIGGQNCSFTRNVLAGISSLTCSSALITGTLVENVEATSVSVSIPYTGGQGTPYAAQTIPSTGVTGLTATLSAGNFVNGNGNVNFTISGTPNASGTASFVISIGGQSCTLNLNVLAPIVASLDCLGAVHNGTLSSNQVASSGVTTSINYTGGNGLPFGSQSVSSTGVTGLTASLVAGTLANGSGSLLYTITGTPSSGGTASFTINIGGQSCTFTRLISLVTALDCAGATHNGNLISGTTASGVSSDISYTGGNGASYASETVSSTGVIGLIATLSAGTLANGNGTLTYSITGTPSGSGTASFEINIGGQSCNLTRVVSLIGSVTTLDCAGATISGTLMQNVPSSSVTASINYTGGNGGLQDGQIVTSTGVTGLTATLNASTLANGNGALIYSISGTPSSSGNATFAISVSGQSCTLTIPVSAAIPASIVLGQNGRYIFASLYDQNYLPFTMPTTAATTDTPVNPDGVNEPIVANYQGTITTTGVTVKIPVTATGSGTLPAYSSTITIPASLTEDGISRDLTLTWTAQAYTSTTRSINATIRAVGGTLNAKKLDINAGLGNDFLGILLGAFPYPYNNAGSLTTYQVRVIPGIPDKMFGLADNAGNSNSHLMLYLPMIGDDGNVWLNNNLGADYANLNNPSFSMSQATNETDHLAYGSLFQWGRKPDGHELINWTSPSVGVPVHNIATLTVNNNPTDTAFVLNAGTSGDWRVTADNTLWSMESSPNNPCPYGFRVPTYIELGGILTAANITTGPSAFNSILKLTLNGYRNGYTWSGTGAVGASGPTGTGAYWSTSTYYLYLSGIPWQNSGIYDSTKVMGRSVRCIMN